MTFQHRDVVDSSLFRYVAFRFAEMNDVNSISEIFHLDVQNKMCEKVKET